MTTDPASIIGLWASRSQRPKRQTARSFDYWLQKKRERQEKKKQGKQKE